jgi:hypothetical protein
MSTVFIVIGAAFFGGIFYRFATRAASRQDERYNQDEEIN